MNYEVAPEAHYPTPVLQVDELYKDLQKTQPKLDLNRVIFGGDSAGAQIASQYMAIQTNPAFAKEMQLKASVPKKTLKAVLLYCGPYDIKSFGNVKGGLIKYFLKNIGWAYIGKHNWLDSKEAKQASTVEHVTADYPPTFITDGNSGSFEPQGKELGQNLKTKGVPVETLFFPTNEGAIGHEYQFMLNTSEAKLCMQTTLAFLKKYQ